MLSINHLQYNKTSFPVLWLVLMFVIKIVYNNKVDYRL